MFLKTFGKLSGWMNAFAGIILFLMMMLTVVDVIMRAFGKPITGTYEIISMAGALVIAFSIAQTTWDKAHVYVDFLIENRSPATKKIFITGTRIVGIFVFGLLSWRMFLKGGDFLKSGEVSLTIHLPQYPIAYALSFCFCVFCLVLVADIVKLFVKEDSHE
jgi:TRAP-type C4-dicarboxylate transport system permease small subunit